MAVRAMETRSESRSACADRLHAANGFTGRTATGLGALAAVIRATFAASTAAPSTPLVATGFGSLGCAGPCARTGVANAATPARMASDRVRRRQRAREEAVMNRADALFALRRADCRRQMVEDGAQGC